MRASAQDQVYPMLLALEASGGPINWMYFDYRKDKPDQTLLTWGLGSMHENSTRNGPDDYAQRLPWRHKNGRWDISEAEVVAEYERLKALGIQKQGGYAYRKYANLFLDQGVVQWDFDQNFAGKIARVKQLLPNFDSLRADAQLAIALLVWNTGPGVLDPNLKAYWQSLTVPLKAGDYVGASDHCMINGTTSERNRWDRKMFLQAARAELMGADPDTLFGSAVSISAANVINKDPAKPGSHAFWTQAVMRVTGHYTLKLDGLFGPKSMAAFNAATGSDTVTRAALQKLADDTEWTLGVTVVG